MQGVFCLGLIWRMEPLEMPRAFCIVQNVLVSLGSFLLTGVTASFTLGTIISLFRPQYNTGTTISPFSWHPRYIIFIVVYPLLASVVYVSLLFRLDAATPTEDLLCEATHPIWVRLFGYAGVPLLLSIPSLLLSSISAICLLKKQAHLPNGRKRGCVYQRQDTLDPLTPLPARRQSRQSKSLEFRTSADIRNANTPTPVPSTLAVPTPVAVPSPTSSAVLSNPHLLQSPGRVPTSPEVASFARKYHLPFNRQPAKSPSPIPRPPSHQSSTYFPSDTSISSVFPTFAPPSRPGSVRSLPAFPDLGALSYRDLIHGKEHEERELGLSKMVSSTAVGGDEDEERWVRSLELSKSELEFVRNAEDREGDGWAAPTYVRRNPLSKMMRDKTTPPLPPSGPAPCAMWHFIVFQITVSVIQMLASITTLIDVGKGRAVPTPFGTQHFALLLVAWCPCFVFGYLPGVRQRLKFWKRRRFF
ncbi:hypothetical protein GLOTRDRAFT_139824 [Gloeophyllum trabeum ATCC 11539]|uniref:Uncharacterized protein n=1 Tax=Gloeophyllum trabeum (strain ATCC 11539 / FP-39264 / Madison 617) TaxID=670483 RepID=S7Q144_GLOTA|nr:uncharacterized protein GLOTRDRAFT_139824 [Gloeophyllum trabeum ATCC 11539]EPQ53666.1 hypothetical protein GLOTRDRAFT_139824 [Gloeophyllum trabeum ATCC 11539]